MVYLVIAIDGFQHGSGPFFPKCVAIEEAKSGINKTAILNLPDEALDEFYFDKIVANTFNFQKRMHGLDPEQRGISEYYVPGIIDDVVKKASGSFVREEQNFCYAKGKNIFPIVNMYKERSCLSRAKLFDLEELGCPSYKNLGLSGKPIFTVTKAHALAMWVKTTQQLTRQLL